MIIGIRADGGTQIGMGHIMRTLVLANEFLKYKSNEVFYICLEGDKYQKGIEEILNEGFHIKFIKEGNSFINLKTIYAELLITDSYNISEEYFDVTKKIFSKTAYVDDMNLHYFNVDFLINQNIGAEELDYKVNKDTKLMLGATYTMLREEFRNISQKHIKEKVSNIMITVGGSDPYHVTERLLSYVKDLNYNFHVVVGPSFCNIQKLKIFESKNIKFYYNADMYTLMKQSDMAISGCGSTLYELALCGVPTIGIVIAGNQQRTGDKLSDMKVIKNIGWYSAINKEILIHNIETLANDKRLRCNMSETSSNLIDGKGVKRIVDQILNEVK